MPGETACACGFHCSRSPGLNFFFPFMKTPLSVVRIGLAWSLNRRRQRPALASARFCHTLELACAALTFGLAAGAVAQTNPTSVVTEPAESALRQAMTNGGWIVLACDGTFALSGTINVATNTVLDGTGHSVTLRGGSYAQVLSVSPDVTLTLSNLTIQGG